MSCETFKETLIEVAFNGTEPNANTRAHLDACSSCRSFLEREQLLLALIDAGLRQTANTAVPATFLRNLGARLAQETPPNHIARLRWAQLAAVAAVLVVLLLPVLRPRTIAQRIASDGIRQPSPQPYAAQKLASAQPAMKSSGLSRIAPHVRKQSTPSVTKGSPEVLIPPEEREAFARFASNVVERRELAAALLTPAPEKKAEPLDVAPLQIARLEIKPLEEERAPADAGRQAE
jgi:hypothetical protein